MFVKIDDLSFNYPGVDVLRDITFDMDKPELVGILGPNGVGKSTLIHCMDRILQPTKGAVLIDDRSVKDINLKELAKIMGYVPCVSAEAFPMTVLDTILVGRHPHNDWRLKKKDFDVVEEAMQIMGISDLALRHFNELSAGQKQKVMLARGLVQEPNVLLLDEPTANLDIKHQYGVSKMLRSISRTKNVLVIMICHDLNIAAKYCDRIMLLSNKTIYAAGTPQEVITAENVKTVYGVDCEVIQTDGVPHVIVKDSEEYKDCEVKEEPPCSAESSEEQTV